MFSFQCCCGDAGGSGANDRVASRKSDAESTSPQVTAMAEEMPGPVPIAFMETTGPEPVDELAANTTAVTQEAPKAAVQVESDAPAAPEEVRKEAASEEKFLAKASVEGNASEEVAVKDGAQEKQAAEVATLTEESPKPKVDGEGGLLITFAAPPMCKDGDGNIGAAVPTEDVKINLVFTTKPLGIDFKPSVPIVVSKAVGQAAMKGVKEGWKIMEVAGEPLNQQMSFDEAVGVFKSKVDEKIPNGVNVIFRSLDGEEKSVYFPRKPLGMDLGRTVPMTVGKVTESAVALGVQVGWRVTEVNGIELNDSMTFDTAFSHFKTQVAALP